MKTRASTALSILCVALGGCSKIADAAQDPAAGGAATVFDVTRNAFSFPVPGLSDEHRRAFFVGNSFFNENWISAPASVASRDGLGPLFNARSCSACHFKDGRSRPPDAGQPMSTMLLRISLPGHGPHGEPVPDPVYGDQIQGGAVPGVEREADVFVEYEPVAGTFADGEAYELRRPRYRVANLAYGALDERILTSPRVAPAMSGLGLLEAVRETDLTALADPDDRDRDGISGRANVVWDIVEKKAATGRFGWKAEQPTVLQQSAGAFVGDIGITSSLFQAENHTGREGACNDQPNGGVPEVSDEILKSVGIYARSLAVPARRHPTSVAARPGERLFEKARCGACHLAKLTTGPVSDLTELSGQTIHPYTDLLLHDMGEGLGDGRPTFAASGTEWRTPPLWGIGLVGKVNGHTFFLHDGRARNLTEAILWHDGEGRAARVAFAAMTRSDREALVAFLESL